MPPAVLDAPPAPAKPSAPRTAAPPPATPAAPPDGGSVVLHGVTWPDYERFLELAGPGVRLTYDHGTLELQMPSTPHERLKFIAGRFIEAFAEHRGIAFDPTGSTTWRREASQAGLEADESYYFARAAEMAAVDQADLSIHPPPELAVEIDLSPPRVAKQSVYARLGVPEIWRWRDGRLAVLLRDDAGRYAESDRSRCLPDFPLEQLAAALADDARRPVSELTAAFRRGLASSPAAGAV